MKRIFLISALFFFNQLLYAQSVKEIEDSVAFYLNGIEQYNGYAEWREGKIDTLDYYNNTLLRYLENNLEKQPLTLEAKFSRITKSGMHISTSEDKHFRIYSWNVQSGGTMQGFNSVFQFKVGRHTYAKVLYVDTFIQDEWQGPGYFYPEIHNVKSVTGEKYYLAKRIAVWSSKYVTVGIQAFAVEGNRLNDSIKIFKTSKTTLNNIDCEYEYLSNYNHKTRNENNSIHFSKDNKKLYIPIVNEEKMTNKYLVYKWDGNYYVFDRDAK